jgi:cytochrome c oxidase subunit 2
MPSRLTQEKHGGRNRVFDSDPRPEHLRSRIGARPFHFHLAGFVLAITGAIFVVVAVCLLMRWFVFVAAPDDDGTEPAQIYGSGPVEAAWTIVPFLIVVVLTLTTARVIQEMQDARQPAAALDVQVIGHQWWWEFRYPKLGIVTANELHVPVSQAGAPIANLPRFAFGGCRA